MDNRDLKRSLLLAAMITVMMLTPLVSFVKAGYARAFYNNGDYYWGQSSEAEAWWDDETLEINTNNATAESNSWIWLPGSYTILEDTSSKTTEKVECMRKTGFGYYWNSWRVYSEAWVDPDEEPEPKGGDWYQY